MQGTTEYNQLTHCYAVLNLNSGIPLTKSVLDKAYKTAAVKYHPDKNKDMEAGRMMSIINETKSALEPLAEKGDFILVDEITTSLLRKELLTREADLTAREAAFNAREAAFDAREAAFDAREAEFVAARQAEITRQEELYQESKWLAEALAEEEAQHLEQEKIRAQELAYQEEARLAQELVRAQELAYQEKERIAKQNDRQVKRQFAERALQRNKNEIALEKFLEEHEIAKKEWLKRISEEINFRENKKLEEKMGKIKEIISKADHEYETRMKQFDGEIVAIKALYEKAVGDYEIDFKIYESNKSNRFARPPKEIPSWNVPLEKWEKRKQNFIDHHVSFYRLAMNAIEEEYKEDVILTDEPSKVRLPDGWEMRRDKKGGIYYFEPMSQLKIEESEGHKLHYYR